MLKSVTQSKKLGNFVRLYTSYTFNASDTISFRIYPDNRPRNLEIAPLQKGLVLLFNGTELIEEGAGFGVPVVKYSNDTYFSCTSELFHHSQDRSIFKKVYNMDVVSRKQILGVFINEKLYSLFHWFFERLYLRQSSRSIFGWAMWLRKALGMKTQFVKAPFRGRITITYHCMPGQVDISVDLSGLDKSQCREILLLNEQGATRFHKYFDSDKTTRYGAQIGAWTKVKAKQAILSDEKICLSFSLENLAEAILFCGREQIKDRFSWAGMTYALNPCSSSFNYTVWVNRIVQ